MYTYTYMNITTYIRKEDEHLWKAIPNKAEWLHAALNNAEYRVPQSQIVEPTYETPTPDFKKTENIKMNVLSLEDIQKKLGVESTPKIQHVCKENCYHWVYDINSAQYTNSLTGETREAPEF